MLQATIIKNNKPVNIDYSLLTSRRLDLHLF